MTTVKTGAAQGDLLIIRIDAIPPGALPVEPEGGRLILARGEATGHHHSFRAGPPVMLFRDTEGGLCFTANETAHLEHQEHATITFDRGTYKVMRQRTFEAGMARRVAD